MESYKNVEHLQIEKKHYIVYFIFIIIGIGIIIISSIYVSRYFTIIKTVGIISKVTCSPNTTKKSLYNCELTIKYDTNETVITVENNVKYSVNDSITIYHPENNSSNISLIDMDYKTIGFGGIAIGSSIFLVSAVSMIST